MPNTTPSPQPPTHPQRLPEYRRDDNWIRSFLQRAEIGRIATSVDGQPYITPTTFWYDPQAHTIIFHGANHGHLYANLQTNPHACFETSKIGELLPADTALEFSIQYASVIAFGRVRILDDPDEKRRGLYALIGKYFPQQEAGRDYRPITEKELNATAVYALEVERWSGKENWKDPKGIQ